MIVDKPLSSRSTSQLAVSLVNPSLRHASRCKFLGMESKARLISQNVMRVLVFKLCACSMWLRTLKRGMCMPELRRYPYWLGFRIWLECHTWCIRREIMVVRSLRSVSYRLMGRMLDRSVLPGDFGTSRTSLSRIHVGMLRDVHTMRRWRRTKSRIAGDQHLIMVADSSDGPGAEP